VFPLYSSTDVSLSKHKYFTLDLSNTSPQKFTMATQVLLSTIAILVLALLTPSGAFQVANNPRPVVATASTSSLDALSRREALTAASAATMLVVGGVLPQDALAAATKGPDVKVFAFNGIFKDPKHPRGYRIIAGKPNKEGTMTLQDEPDSLVFNIPIKAKTDEKDGLITLDIDFSEKGGPSDVVATFNKKDSSISFPDGNVWKKETKGVAGVYVDAFAPYPKYRRIIREDGEGSGRNLIVSLVSGKKTFIVAGKAGYANRDVVIDFPGDKTCSGQVNTKKGTITWPDGNVWTRV